MGADRGGGARDGRLFVSVWLVVALLASPRTEGVQNRYLGVARALADRGTFAVDAYRPVDMTDVDVRDGRAYTRAMPGHPLLLAPLVPIADAFRGLRPAGDDPYALRPLKALAVLLVQAPAAAGAAVLVARTLRALGVEAARAAVCGAALPLSTSFLFYAARVSENAVVALLEAALLLALARARVAPETDAPPRAAGLAAGLLVPTHALAAAVSIAGAAVLLPRRGRTWAAFTAGLIPGAALLAAYQWAVFGAPWRFGFHTGEGGYQAVLAAHAGSIGDLVGAVAREAPVALGHLSIGSRGIWLYAPITLPATIAVLLGLRRRDEAGVWCRAAAGVTALNLAVLFFFLEGLWAGAAAWGPRHLLPSLPWLATALPLGLPRLGTGAIGAFAALGLALNWAGVLHGYAIWPWPALAAFLERGPRLPLAEAAVPGASLPALVVLAAALAWLWRPAQTS